MSAAATTPHCHVLTDIGLGRATNQDAAFAAARDGQALAAVSDGMGGLPAGDRASSLVIAECERLPGRRDEPEAWLTATVRAAGAAIARDIDGHPERAGMGATLVLAIARGDVAWLANVGDSRAYRWREGALERLTRDHTAARDAVERGELDPALEDEHPLAHVLTRAVTAHPVRPDLLGPLDLTGGALLLVSDGVSKVLTDRDLAPLVAGHRCGALARAVLHEVTARGAPDNVAVALLDYRPCDA